MSLSYMRPCNSGEVANLGGYERHEVFTWRVSNLQDRRYEKITNEEKVNKYLGRYLPTVYLCRYLIGIGFIAEQLLWLFEDSEVLPTPRRNLSGTYS